MDKCNRLGIALLCLALTPLAGADEEFDTGKLVDQVAGAYGVTLDNIDNYRITEHYIAPATGQSWSPALVDIGEISQEFTHDVAGGRIYFENWFAGRNGLFPTLTLVEGEKARAVNLVNNRYGDATSADPYIIAGGTMRTTDTLLALELLKARDKAKYAGSATFYNRDHHLLQIPFPSSPELTLYIDKESHLINRMTRENPQLGLLDYVYLNHRQQNGFTSASTVNFSVAGDPNLIGAQRRVEFNQDLPASIFALPAGLEQEGERFDDSEMVVNRISDRVYHIGQSGAYSLFVDTDNGVIGTGGYAGLNQRLQRFREETGSYQPLRYQIVTHHHSDHLGGMAEALALGATLVTVAENRQPVIEASREQPESSRFLMVDKRLSLGSGGQRVELYDVATEHANSNLLVYVPGARVLFMADHFGTPYRQGTPVATANTVSMSAALEPLNLKFNRVVTAHGGRVFSDRDFADSVAGWTEFKCPESRPLCPRPPASR